MRLRTNPDSEENIRRIDSKKTHGFQVHFSRGDTDYTKLCSDGVCGGKELARNDARAFREILRASIPPSRAGSPARTGPARSNTGHMGISISGEKLKSGAITLYVEASVRIEKGKAKNRQFRVADRPLSDVIAEAQAWRESLINERLRREAL